MEVEKAAMMTAPMGFDNQDSVKDNWMAKDLFHEKGNTSYSKSIHTYPLYANIYIYVCTYVCM